MNSSIQDIPKRRGRPKTTGRGEGVLVRLQPAQIRQLDAWIAEQPDPKPTRPAAVRQILDGVLSGQPYRPTRD